MAGAIEGRLEASRRTLVLAIGDAAMIAAFVGAGELRHGGTLAAGVETYLQFAAGWSLAAIAIGAYGRDSLDSPRRAAALAVGGWILGALIAQVLRALARPGFYVAPSFVAVSIVTGGLLLLAWRAVAAVAFD